MQVWKDRLRRHSISSVYIGGDKMTFLSYIFYYSIVLIIGIIVWWLYALSQAQKPRLYGKPSKLKAALLRRSSVLNRKYYPPFWCISGTLHTIARQMVKTTLTLPFKREILKLDDGGHVGLDWSEPSQNTDTSKAPLILILPGLTGCTFESYVSHLVKTASENGYRTVVFNNRGNGGVELLTSRTYCAAHTGDLKAVIDHIHGRNPGISVIAVGFSLGGMILFNYISKFDANECGLKAAMVVCSPWNAVASTKSLEKPLNRLVFNHRLAKNLCKNIERNRQIFEKVVGVDHILKSELIREFDERFVVPMFKYKDVLEYYHDASFYYKINSACIPTLCLNAADDCFAPIETIPLDRVQQTDNVIVVVTSHGGHLGFMNTDSPTQGGFVEDLFSEYIKVVLDMHL